MKTNDLRDRIYARIKSKEDDFFKSKDDPETLPSTNDYGEILNGNERICFSIFTFLTLSFLFFIPIVYIQIFLTSLIDNKDMVSSLLISAFLGLGMGLGCFGLPFKITSILNHKKVKEHYSNASETEKRRVLKFLYKDKWLSENLDSEVMNLIKIYLSAEEYTAFMLKYENNLTYHNLETFMNETDKIRSIQEQQKEVLLDISIENNTIQQKNEQYTYVN